MGRPVEVTQLQSVRILITGGAGQLGAALKAEWTARNRRYRPSGRSSSPYEATAVSSGELDVTDRDQVFAAMAELEPEIVIHCAALTDVDACELDPRRAFQVNALGTRFIAEASRFVGAHLCYISTDYVFDGELGRPYHEWDRTSPISVYGASKLAGEHEAGSGSLIVRTSWVYGRLGRDAVATMVRLYRDGQPMRYVADQYGSPTSTSVLAARVADLSLARRTGVVHVAGSGEASRFDMARAVVEILGGSGDLVEPIGSGDLLPARPARRPRRSSLENLAMSLGGDGDLIGWRQSLEQHLLGTAQVL